MLAANLHFPALGPHPLGKIIPPGLRQDKEHLGLHDLAHPLFSDRNRQPGIFQQQVFRHGRAQRIFAHQEETAAGIAEVESIRQRAHPTPDTRLWLQHRDFTRSHQPQLRLRPHTRV